MSSKLPIGSASDFTAPTPQNTPLNKAPINFGLSRPTVPDISEEKEGEGAEAGGPSMDDLQETMLGMVEGKLATLIGKSSGYIESLPVEVKLNVEALKGLQKKQDDLHREYQLECIELQKKYLQLQKPLFDRREAIMNGKEPATREEVEAGEQVSLEDNDEYTPLPKDSTPSPSGIPHFWLTALRNHVGLNDLINDRDAEALKYLLDVCLDFPKEDESQEATTKAHRYSISFYFGPNEYFENDVLVKTYVYKKDVDYWGEFNYDRAVGTAIKWKEEKDLTKEFEIKKQRNKNTNRIRLVRKAHPVDSFFNFFTPPEPPSEEASGELDDDELEELEEKLEVDFLIGEDLKEKIIPHAVDYFTGKALEHEPIEDDDEFTDDEEEDEDGDSDESDDDVPPPRFGRPSKPRGGPPSGKHGNNEEWGGSLAQLD